MAMCADSSAGKTARVDVEHDFKMKYMVIERNKKHVDAICQAVKEAQHVFLATDGPRR